MARNAWTENKRFRLIMDIQAQVAIKRRIFQSCHLSLRGQPKGT